MIICILITLTHYVVNVIVSYIISIFLCYISGIKKEISIVPYMKNISRKLAAVALAAW